LAAPTRLSLAEVAARAGVEPGAVEELTSAGVLRPVDGGYTLSDARRIRLVGSVIEAGVPLASVAAAVSGGLLSLDFADSPVYERFAALTNETFESVSARTGIPLALLAVVREAVWSGTMRPGDLLREDELAVVPFVEIQVRLGFRAQSIERLLRATADSLHRIAEAEAEWFRAEVAEPLLRAGRQNEIALLDPAEGLSEAEEQALLAIYHAQQAQTWTSNVIAGFEYVLNEAGLHETVDRPAAICFLDITGYTRLTQERGDQAAADLAERLAAIVKRSSAGRGGRPVKWLGDGVMFYFRDPGPGVLAAIEMVEGIAAAGLPPAHVGLHAGPLVMQEGDFYGQTVNMASRIAEYARPGEVLVSDTVVAQADGSPVAFAEIGPVELKGVSGAVRLFAARRAAN